MIKKLFPDDLVDTRKLIERIEELELDHMDGDGIMTDVGLWDTVERVEYRGLAGLVEKIGEEACRDGVTLIHEAYFRDHIKEEYLEIGGEYHEEVPRSNGKMRYVPLVELYSRRPFNSIDWDAVASDEESDYSQVEIDGATYYYQEP